MQQLEPINVGQQANDGSGDPLRDGMQKVNANFTKVQAGVGAVEQNLAATTDTANAAKTKADGAIPAAQKGMAGGVAPLGADGKVSSVYLGDYVLTSQKDAANGVAPLDSQRRVPPRNGRYPEVQGSVDGQALSLYLESDDYYIRVAAPDMPAGFTGQGMLRVRTYASMTLQELIQWESAAGRWWRMKLNAAGNYGPWQRVVAEGGALRRIRITAAATDANTLTAENAFYVWSNSNVMGANFPNITGAGHLLPAVLSGDTMSQELHIVAGGRKPWIFQRFLPTSGVWQPWKVVGPVSSAAVMPNWDAGDIYVDGAGWYAWNGTAYALTPLNNAGVTELRSDLSAMGTRATTLEGQILGRGQSWQDVSASRVRGTNYTNSTGRPIIVVLTGVVASASSYAQIAVSGVVQQLVGWGAGFVGGTVAISTVVPPGASYSANADQISSLIWREYR